MILIVVRVWNSYG